MVGLIELQSTGSWSESMRMEKSVAKLGQVFLRKWTENVPQDFERLNLVF